MIRIISMVVGVVIAAFMYVIINYREIIENSFNKSSFVIILIIGGILGYLFGYLISKTNNRR